MLKPDPMQRPQNQHSAASVDKTKRLPRYPSRWWQWLIVLLVSVGFGANYLWQRSQKPPEFYAELTQLSEQQKVGHAKQFDEKMDRLQQEIESSATDQHSIVFTQDEINSWLSTSLPQRFPNKLPRDLKELLVKLQPEDSSLVMQIDSKYFSGFATADFDLQIGPKPNLLEVQLNRLYSGILSFPINRFRQQIVNGLTKSNLPIQWDSDDLPAKIEVDLDQLLSQQLVRPATITEVRIVEQAIEIDYQFAD